LTSQHTPGISYDPKEISPKAKDPVISLAKQLDHLGQSNSLENGNSEMQSAVNQNEKVQP
jgi:hypothetical protein